MRKSMGWLSSQERMPCRALPDDAFQVILTTRSMAVSDRGGPCCLTEACSVFRPSSSVSRLGPAAIVVNVCHIDHLGGNGSTLMHNCCRRTTLPAQTDTSTGASMSHRRCRCAMPSGARLAGSSSSATVGYNTSSRVRNDVGNGPPSSRGPSVRQGNTKRLVPFSGAAAECMLRAPVASVKRALASPRLSLCPRCRLSRLMLPVIFRSTCAHEYKYHSVCSKYHPQRWSALRCQAVLGISTLPRCIPVRPSS